MTRTGDRAVPTLTPHPIPPNVPMGTWPAQLRVAIEKLDSAAHTWDDDDPTVVWDGGVPAAPTAVAGTAGNGQVSLTWTAPTFDGGSPIIDYVVQYAIDPPGTWTTFTDTVSTATTATVTGLTNGTAYVFQVAAVNADGQGAWSTASSPVTPTAPYTDVLLEPFNTLTAWVATSMGLVTGRTGTGVQSNANGDSCQYTIPSAAEDVTIVVGFAWQSSTLALDNHALHLTSDAAATQHLTFTMAADGKIWVRRGGTTGTVLGSTTGITLAAATWYYVELRAVLDDVVGAVTVRVNGTDYLTLTNVDTKNGGAKTTWDGVRLRGVTGANQTFDDLYISMGVAAPFKGSISLP